MNKIIVNLGNFKLDEIPLNRGSLSIGRADDNDISLADAATSSYHAKIVTIFTSSFIQDLNSTNGTIVNGRKVIRHTLHHGDVISIGNLQLLFKSDVHDLADADSRTALVNKEEIKSIMTASSELQKNHSNADAIEKANGKHDGLAGFSISVPPSASENRQETAVPNIDETESNIPVLEETLPLDELRKNPDRMVVLTPGTKKTVTAPATKTKNKKIGKRVTQNHVDYDRTMLTMESEPTVAFENEHLKKLLAADDFNSYSAKLLAKIAFGILLVVVVLTSVYLLL